MSYPSDPSKTSYNPNQAPIQYPPGQYPPGPGQPSAYGVPTSEWPPAQSKPPAPPVSKGGCGVKGCLLGCFGVFIVFGIALVIGGWVIFPKIPDMARGIAVAAINQSDLAQEDKKLIIEQVDRVVGEYKGGRISLKQVAEVVEQLTQSPLITLMMARAAYKQYIEPSNLTDDEKRKARIVLQRVARGVTEKKIDPNELESAMDLISDKINDSRRFRQTVSDEEVRQFVDECKRIADDAQIPNEEVEIDIGQEFKNAVDRALLKKAEAE